MDACLAARRLKHEAESYPIPTPVIKQACGYYLFRNQAANNLCPIKVVISAFAFGRLRTELSGIGVDKRPSTPYWYSVPAPQFTIHPSIHPSAVDLEYGVWSLPGRMSAIL